MEGELLGRAAGLVPRLKARAGLAEELRRLPAETVADLLASGLYRIGVPRRFGGLDVGYGLALDVAAELGRGCAAAAWCYCLWTAHAWLVGYWPRAAQEEVFGDGPDVLCSSSLNTGKSECVAAPGATGCRGGGSFPAGAISPGG